MKGWRLPLVLCAIGEPGLVLAQTALPDIVVTTQAAKPAAVAAPSAPAPVEPAAPTTPTKIDALDQSRDSFLLPKLGATTYALDRAAIDQLPQGDNTPLDKVILQAPGVSQDSALNNPAFHIRNEYSNVQYRIDGIPLPLGINGLGPALDTSFVGGINLLDGALPAQYGLRTAGVIDIATPRTFEPGGSFSLYGGSFGTFSPRLEYGGVIGDTQYFFTGRYFRSNEGLENAMPTLSPLHDLTEQGKFFGYVSKLLSDSSRLTFMTGASSSQFQIPNVAGQQPLGDFGGANWNSVSLNEREHDNFLFNVAALQTRGETFDTQLALYSGYATAHFLPDVPGDLAFDNAASNVMRRSFSNGASFDGAYRLNDQHVLRGGLVANAESTEITNTSTVLPLDSAGAPLPTPETLTQTNAKVGWTLGAYVQDEWKLTDQFTLNSGLRFDQLYQFVTANQLSPRVSLTWKPEDSTTLHLGYARYFTPPSQVQATPVDLALFSNTTLQPAVEADNPVRPERSHYFDLGADRKIFSGFTVGADVYYKLGTDFLDDGQFGQAPMLTQFNYAHGYAEGVELKAKYQDGDFGAYANFAANHTKATDIVSSQYLFDPAELAYIGAHYIFMDDAQVFTASAGASYIWNKTRFSVDAIYGSGMPTGFANTQFEQPYVQVNLGVSRQFATWSAEKPLTATFSVVNLLDEIYLLRSNTGVGAYAPQYGPRRGFYLTLSQKL